jgi:outer membrane lipoprotein-sorting protein
MNRYSKTSGSLARTALAAALAVCVPITSAIPTPALAATQDDLTRAVDALRAIGTMQADFVQTDRDGNEVRGVLTLKRPGRIRFQYQQGVPMLIVSDGKALTFIDYQVRQVQRWPIKNSPLGALLDPGRDVARYGTLQPTANPNVISIEIRDRTHPEYGVITLIFVRDAKAPGGLELSYWVALDSQNHRTTVRLSNQRYGLAVSDNMFRYNDPRRSSPK